MHSPRSAMYKETLARRGLPPDFLKCYRMCANGVVTPLR
jgi:hypothetical protein